MGNMTARTREDRKSDSSPYRSESTSLSPNGPASDCGEQQQAMMDLESADAMRDDKQPTVAEDVASLQGCACDDTRRDVYGSTRVCLVAEGLGDQSKWDEEAAPQPAPLPMRRTSFSTRASTVLPVRIDMDKLNYWVMRAGAKKPILRDINLTILPGQLLAIMGPSGCGKTSLLRVLHGDRQVVKHISGSVTVNGTPMKGLGRAFRQLCSMVPQQDVLLPCFTVQETLMYTALLRLPQSWSRNEKALIIDSVMGELRLTECRDVLVGSVEKKGISGGQRHRLSIGLELLVDPSVLLLDEPTSGLDSTTAEDICALLSGLTQPGRSVVCSIHQPSARIFMGFDRVCLLIDGHLTYDGPVKNVADFFSSIKFPVPQHENPADHYMRVMRSETQTVLEGWRARSNRFPASCGMEEAGAVEPYGLSRPQSDASASWMAARDWEGTSAWWQFIVLFARMMADSCKDPGKLLSGMVMECTTGLLIGLVWYKQPIYTQKSVIPTAGVMVMLTTVAVFDSTVGVALRFPTTRALHFREYSNGYYELLPYYLASVTSSCLLIAVYQTVQALIAFFMVGLEFSVGRVLVFTTVLVLAACIGGSLGFLLGTLTSNIQRIQQMTTPILMPMLIFSGYMLPYPSIPSYLRWIYWSSLFQYIYSTLLRVHFHGLQFVDCKYSKLWCFKTGDEFLASLEIDPDGTPTALGLLVAMLGGLLIVGYLTLRYKSR